MKKSTRIITVLVTVTLAVMLFATPAFASTYDRCADNLKDLGLFQGTASGYALDEAPTRAQAATMLVRLLGQEDQATSGSYSHPFTDVPSWADPYIGYMYSEGLTKGTTETTFGADTICDAQMYYTFVLRSLGYTEDAADFTYQTAEDVAVKLGLINFDADKPFHRDQMVAISYNALALNTKGATTTLLDKLVSEGAVEQAKAQPYQDMFAAYQAYSTAAISSDTNNSPAISMDMNMDIEMKYNNQPVAVTMQMKYAFIFDEKEPFNSQISMEMDMDTPEEEPVNISIYYLDQAYYLNAAGEKMKHTMTEDEKSTFNDYFNNITQDSGIELAHVDNICTVTAAKKTGNSYQISYDMEMMMKSLAEFLTPTSMLVSSAYNYSINDGAVDSDILVTMSLKEMTISVDVDDNNNATKMQMTLTGQVSAQGETLDMNTSITIENIKNGDEVVVNVPKDLDSYPEEPAELTE